MSIQENLLHNKKTQVLERWNNHFIAKNVNQNDIFKVKLIEHTL